jgi:HAD superfamily hydrolase (TIGR01548 family)
MVKDLIIFDMDGVLVDVTASYRAAIQATVLQFTSEEPAPEEIQEWKNRGGFNDDWHLSHQMVLARGGKASHADVVEYFQQIFRGDGNDGLILKERWLAGNGLLDRLAATHLLAIFTGRLRDEAKLTLDRFTSVPFAAIVCVDDVSRPKPHPEGLLRIISSVRHGACWYVGDTVDDARASSAAGIPFVGIAEPSNPRHAELATLLRNEGAVEILDDIQSLEAAIAANR